MLLLAGQVVETGRASVPFLRRAVHDQLPRIMLSLLNVTRLAGHGKGVGKRNPSLPGHVDRHGASVNWR